MLESLLSQKGIFLVNWVKDKKNIWETALAISDHPQYSYRCSVDKVQTGNC